MGVRERSAKSEEACSFVVVSSSLSSRFFIRILSRDVFDGVRLRLRQGMATSHPRRDLSVSSFHFSDNWPRFKEDSQFLTT